MSDPPKDSVANSMQDNQKGETSQINIKLPPFWSNSPVSWFVQAEAQFALNKIKNDTAKYYNVITSLSQEISESISDLLVNPPKSNLYETLKTTLIQRNSLSIELRLKKLLSNEQMGDKKPSEFYRYLKNLAGISSPVSNDLIRNLWQTRLPKLINIALIPQKDLKIDDILMCADQVWEALQESNISVVNSPQQNVPSTSTPSQDSSYLNLEKQIHELKELFNKMNNSHSRDSRSRSNSRSRSGRNRSGSRQSFNKAGKFCWYHFKYAERASKCIEPCQWKNFDKNNAQPKN